MRSSLDEPRHADRWTIPAMLLLLLGTALARLFRRRRRQLTLVSTAWPPFTNAPGQPRFALDLVEAALGRIGLSAKTTIVDAAQFTPSLLTARSTAARRRGRTPSVKAC